MPLAGREKPCEHVAMYAFAVQNSGHCREEVRLAGNPLQRFTDLRKASPRFESSKRCELIERHKRRHRRFPRKGLSDDLAAHRPNLSFIEAAVANARFGETLPVGTVA